MTKDDYTNFGVIGKEDRKEREKEKNKNNRTKTTKEMETMFTHKITNKSSEKGKTRT